MEIWGRQIIIDNRPGAGGAIGGEIVARATPDGYTVLLATGGTNIGNTLLSKKPPYRVEDFAYVAIAADNPLVIIVTPSFPANTPREFARPEVRRRLGDLGMDIVGGSPEDATKYVMTQVSRVRGLIKAGVLTPE